MGRGRSVTTVLGIGHESQADFAALLALVEHGIRSAGLMTADINAIASIDTREAGGLVAALARHFGVPAHYFPAARLEMETPRLIHPSPALFQRIGCHGVAEAAALAAAGPNATLVLPKITGDGVTCAIAQNGANRG